VIHTTQTLTLGGLLIGVTVLAYELWMWWRTGSSGGTAPIGPGTTAGRGRDPKALAPLASGIAFGAMCVGCPAGLLGAFAGLLRGLGDGAGGGALHAATGHTAPAVANAAAPGLDDYGATVVTITLLLVLIAWKRLAKTTKGHFRNGVIAGCLLCISSGAFAYIGLIVIPACNGLGHQAVGGLVGGTFA
jgi:hypothetical protein